jgi:hypothetical protein
MVMHVTCKSGRWLPVRIDDVEKWQVSLLEESARRLGAVLAPGGPSSPLGLCRIADYVPRPARVAADEPVP